MNVFRSLVSLCLMVMVATTCHPAQGRTWIVSQDGTGDFTVVSEACAAADSTDTLLIRPGEYDEYDGIDYRIVLTDKPLALVGDTVDPRAVSLRMSFSFRSCYGTLLENLRIHDECNAVLCNKGSIRIRNCVFEDNQGNPAGVEGGAVLVYNMSETLVEDTVFARNSVVGGEASGGALYGNHITVRRCIFFDNYASWHGGAIYSNASPCVEECVFFRNAALNGAAVSLGYDVELRQCTFLANEVLDGFGAAVELDAGGRGGIQGCIVAGTVNGYGLGCWAPLDIFCFDFWDNELGDCATDFNCGLYEMFGNIFVDPMFCDPEICDVGLLPGSPCLPGNHGGHECGLIGAYGVGCGEIPVREVTWGEVKALYR